MMYLVPGAVAGIVVYLMLALVSWGLARCSSHRLRLSAHVRLIIVCLVVVAFTVLLVRDGGGNWATHYQVAGFLLVGCLLTTITALTERRRRNEDATTLHTREAASD